MITNWTPESLSAETRYRREQLHRLVGHSQPIGDYGDYANGDSGDSAGHRSGRRAGRWWDILRHRQHHSTR